MSNKKFKALEYVTYNRIIGLDRYKYLHELLDYLFAYLPFEKNQFDHLLDKEFQYQFEYMDLTVYIDKQFEFYQAEITGTDKLPLEKRIKLHEKKIKSFKKDII